MAIYQLDPTTGIETISGALSRRRLQDGSVQVCVVTKRGRMYFRTYQRRTPVSEKELAARQRFANVSAEVKRRMEAGDTRRRGIIFKEVYAERKAVDSKNIESASKASRKHPEGKC